MTTEAPSIRTWDDIVFENRHKDYGAYAIRQTYNRNIALSIIIVSTVTLLACFISRQWPDTPPQEQIIGDRFDFPFPQQYMIIPRIGVSQTKTSRQPPRVTHDEIPQELSIDNTDNTSKRIGNTPEPELLPEIINIEAPSSITFPVPYHDIGCSLPIDTVTYVPIMPSFKGGYEAMRKFISRNIRYPLHARRDGIEGSVFVSFLINTSGKVVDTRIVQGIDATCDKEAARVVASMPDWNTGLQDNGAPVPVRLMLPIKFELLKR